MTVARRLDLIEDLKRTFADVRSRVGPPSLVLGCDCILRQLELEQGDDKDAAGQIFIDNNVVGFSTYGEQFNAMHMNQSFVGIAFGRGP